jgi:hypothetical protein
MDTSKTISGKLFDHVVGAYMINGVQNEKGRTRYEKCVSDLITCIGLPTSCSGELSNQIRILFMDDVIHEQMIHPNVKYILCKPYVYFYDYSYMIETYYNTFMKDVHGIYFLNTDFYKNNFKNHMMTYLSTYGFNHMKKSNEEYSEDNLISFKILDHVKQFYG